MGVFLDYTPLRKSLCAKRNTLDNKTQRDATTQVLQQLLQLDVFQNAHSVGLYCATRGEIDVFALAAQPNKQFLLPIMQNNQTLIFSTYQPGDILYANRYGISEPDASKKIVPLEQIDLIILPLVAFDETGQRLGRGAGYYDRTLHFIQQTPRPQKPYLIGVAY